MRLPILVKYGIDGEMWLNDFGGLTVFYIPYMHFEGLAAGYTTECILCMRFGTWCIFKLDCYVNFCSACLIIIVVNDITHLGSKVISLSWAFGDVAMSSDFSDNI